MWMYVMYVDGIKFFIVIGHRASGSDFNWQKKFE